MSVGELTFIGNVELGSNSDWLVELGGTSDGEFDLTTFSGDLTIDGVLQVSLLSGFTLESSQEFVFGEIGGNSSGAFLGLNEGSVVGTFNGVNLFLSYIGGDGNDLVLTSVPEPGSLGLIGLIAIGLCMRRTRMIRS